MWIGTNKNVDWNQQKCCFPCFLPAKTMAVLSSSCTIIDPNLCCFHDEERHGTRRFCVAFQECSVIMQSQELLVG